MKRFFRNPFILSLAIIFGLVFLNIQGWLVLPKDVFLKLTSPWQRISYQFSLKVSNFVNSVVSLQRLNQENAFLKQEKLELLGRISQLEETERENEFLREQINLPLLESRELILAKVIGWDSSNLRKYILIDKGSEKGIEDKAAIITAGNLLAGQVVEIGESWAKVRLITDVDSKINVLIQGTETAGLLKGDQGGLIVDLLPPGEKIESGETIITSGLAGFFPAGLLVGQIEEVFSSQVQISQQARVKPLIDFKRLDKVFVIKE